LGKTAACADDIGIAMKLISTLRTLQPNFGGIRAVSAKELNEKKCVVVPVALRVPDCAAEERFRGSFPPPPAEGVLWSHTSLFAKLWLKKFLPPGKNFVVATAAPYLGVIIGPEADSSVWEKTAREVERAGGNNICSRSLADGFCKFVCFEGGNRHKLRGAIRPLPRLKRRGATHYNQPLENAVYAGGRMGHAQSP